MKMLFYSVFTMFGLYAGYVFAESPDPHVERLCLMLFVLILAITINEAVRALGRRYEDAD